MASHDVEQQILIGILAVQMEMISRDDFAKAVESWLADRSKPLDEILIDDGMLREQDRELILPLLANDKTQKVSVAAKLALAMTPSDSLTEKLERSGDKEIGSTLVRLGLTSRNPVELTKLFSTKDESEPVQPTVSDRYQRIRLHAKGGQGAVHVALDSELNRLVALKEIKSTIANNSDFRSRFILEAEVTGGLEHPGIVPVYGLGSDADGQLFYAMKLIEGTSLRESVETFHQTHANDPKTFQSIEFRRLLGHFVDVCQAVEYAHSRGVLHRDIKPDNIMLGKFGETLVVDWGLAKVGALPTTQTPDQEKLQLRSLGRSDATQNGSMVGTPGFMPPEQIKGDHDNLNSSSDVYALGVTLYVLLTGQSPFQNGNLNQKLNAVCKGKFDNPISLNPIIPKPLEAICLRAMATKQSDRYQSARELSEELECFLADEKVDAYEEPFYVKARRWIRNHPTLTTTSASIALFAICAISIFAIVVGGKNRELVQANRDESEARKLAEDNERIARSQSQLAFSTLETLLLDLQWGLSSVPRGSEIRRRLLATSLDKLDALATEYLAQSTVDTSTIVALHALGDILLEFSGDETFLDQVKSSPEQSAGIELSREFFQRAQQIAMEIVDRDPDDSDALRILATCHRKLGRVESLSGRVNIAQQEYQTCLEVLGRKEIPSNDLASQRDLVSIFVQLGQAQLRLGLNDDARDSFNSASERNETILASSSSTDSDVVNSTIILRCLVEIDMGEGKVQAADEHARNAVRFAKQVSERSPDNFERKSILQNCYLSHAITRSHVGEIEEAIELYQEAVSLADEMHRNDPMHARYLYDLVVGLNGLGFQLSRSGQVSDAHETYQRAVQLATELVARDPNNASRKRDLASVLEHLGKLQLQLGRFEDALTAHERSLEIRNGLVELDKSNVEFSRSIPISLDHLGDVHSKMGNHEDALDVYRQSFQARQQILEVIGDDFETKRGLFYSYQKMGDACQKLERLGDARNWFAEAQQLAESMAETRPNNLEMKSFLAIIYSRLGILEQLDGNLDSALRWFEQTASITEALTISDPFNANAKRDFCSAHNLLADIYVEQSRPQDALVQFEKVLDVKEDLADENRQSAPVQLSLVYTLRETRDLRLMLENHEQAKQENDRIRSICRTVIELDSTMGNAYHFLISSYFWQSDLYRDAGLDDLAKAELETAQQIALDAKAKKLLPDVMDELLSILEEEIQGFQD